MRVKKPMLTVILATPVVLLAVVLLAIKYSRPAMNAPPVGAGAGNTGGANAIGEYLAGNSKPVAPAPAPDPATPPPTPKPVERPVEPARTTYPRGSLTRLPIAAPSGQGTVEVEVFTPPGYDNPALSAQKFGVLYIIGEGVFSPDGLGVDDAASQHISRGTMEPTIVVALPPSGAGRPEQRRAYADWLVMRAAPSIANAYRVAPGRAVTAVGGVGAEAWTALSCATYHADSLGRLLFLDPRGPAPVIEELQPPERAVLADAAGATGGREAVAALSATLKGAGLGPGRLLTLVSGGDDPAGRRQRLEHGLAFLCPPPAEGTK